MDGMVSREMDGMGERDKWVERWTLAKRSERTTETYRRGIGRWFEFCDQRGVNVFAVEQHHVDAYRQALKIAGLEPATIARHLSTISSFYRHLLRHSHGLVDRNPAEWVERPPVAAASRRDGLTKAEATALRSGSIEHGPRTAALVHLLLGTAVRVSEAINATVAGLGWTDGRDRTLAVVRKGGMPDVVVIEAADWAVIDRYLTERPAVPRGWLLASTGGRQMSRQTAYRLVREVADQVTVGKRIGPHSLRHTFATLALDEGLPIQEVQAALRHASSATTQRYDRASRERGRGASRAVAKLWTENST